MFDITIVGLGHGNGGNITLDALDVLQNANAIVLRTRRCSAATRLEAMGIAFDTLDALHDSASDYDALSASIAREVVSRAQRSALVYAVPGSAAFGESGLRVLAQAAAEHGLRVRILPAVGMESIAAAYSNGLDGARIISASDLGLARIDPRAPLIITEIDSRLIASEAKLALLKVYPANLELHFFKRSGEPLFLTLHVLDQQDGYGAECAALLLPCALTEHERYDFDHLGEIVSRLRAPGGCPWDMEQTHESIADNLIEEAWETLAALSAKDSAAFWDELGDVLLQVVFHAQIAQEHGDFDISDVTTAICAKLIHRHPHIFGTVSVSNSEEVLANWDNIKRGEKGHTSIADTLADVPQAFPSLMRAQKVRSRARKAGVGETDAHEALTSATEALNRARDASANAHGFSRALGEALLALSAAAGLRGLQAETALHDATERYIRVFRRLESSASARGVDLKCMNHSELDILWKEACANN